MVNGTSRLLSLDEISKHNHRQSCWVIIHSCVYDLTSFVDEHPGGANVILRFAGKDASDRFDSVHSPQTLESLGPEQHLGKLDPSQVVCHQDDETRRSTSYQINGKVALDAVVNLSDMERAAERLLKPKAWAYYKSAADREQCANRNESDWKLIRLRPRVLRNVSNPTLDTSTKICGFQIKVPIFIAPAALAKLAHPDGEKNLVRAAGKAGIIYIVSSNASYSLEEVAACRAPAQVLFYQLYVNKDRLKSEAVLDRVQKAGYKAIVLTVDAPVPGKRTRDERFNRITNAENDVGDVGTSLPRGKSVATALSGYIDASLNWNDLAWLKSKTSLPIIVKGIQTAEDFMMAHSYGFRHIYLSNHGGRQLDDGPSSIEILLEIKSNYPNLIENCELYIDGGIRDGSTCLKAIALGARAVGIGRPAMYGLIWGERGVGKVIDILKSETDNNLRLLGETSIHNLGPEHVNSQRLARWIYEVPKYSLMLSQASNAKL